MRSAARLLAALVMFATADCSAGRGLGGGLDHTPESFLVRTVSSPERFLISMLERGPSFRAVIFMVLSSGGLAAFSSSFLFEYHRAPASASNTATAMIR